MEVDISWLEGELPPAEPVEEKPRPKGRSTRPPPRRPPTLTNASVRRETLEVAPEWLQVDGEPPPEPPPETAVAKRAKFPRPPWQPPTLPPPPEAVVRKPIRAKAAPIPREDPEEAPASSRNKSKRPPKG